MLLREAIQHGFTKLASNVLNILHNHSSSISININGQNQALLDTVSSFNQTTAGPSTAVGQRQEKK